MSLLTVCQNALYELSGFEVPPNFVGSTNLTARTCVALVQREGNTLEKEHRWTELITTHTFTTTNGTDYYALPSDFRAMAFDSHWDRTNSRKLLGPTAPGRWQWLKSDTASGSAIERFFRIQNGRIHIHPVPTVTGDTIAFDYYSKSWITKQSDASNVAAWTSDADTARIDEDLLTLGLKWRFLQSKGMPFEAEYREYESIKAEMLADNGGKPLIDLGPRRLDMSNLPDTGFGS